MNQWNLILKTDVARQGIREVDLLPVVYLLPHQISASFPGCQRSCKRAATPTQRCRLFDTYAKAKVRPLRGGPPVLLVCATRSTPRRTFVRQAIQPFLRGIASLHVRTEPIDLKTR